jgi:hypothetical protein
MRNTAQVAGTTASTHIHADVILQDCHVRLSDGDTEWDNVQAAVDASTQPTDVVKVAGVCAGVNTRGGVRQMVYVSKTVTVRGGYTITNWSAPYPITQPTTLNALEWGRVFYITGDISATVEGLQITGGDATGLGGGFWSKEEDAGGAVYIITATVTLNDNQIFSNTAAYIGGGLYLSDGEALIKDNTFSSNFADRGGGLSIWHSDATIISNTISSHYAYHWGGGLHLKDSVAMLSGNIVTSNTARASSGGGLLIDGSDAILTDNTIHKNLALLGGGLFLGNSPGAILTGNTIVDNIALGPANNKMGGGLYCGRSDNVTLADNVIRGNFGGTHGGGLVLQDCDEMKLVTNTIADNFTVWWGGGLHIGNSAHIQLTNNVISDNLAIRGGGGGIDCATTDNITLTGNIVISNSAGPDRIVYVPVGGGLRFMNSTNTSLTNNTIVNNNASTLGGGLYLESSDAVMTNNIIADNQADIAGSGLYLADSSSRLLHTTIAGNTGGDGGGVYVTGTLSTVALTNTILVSHTVGITVAADSTAILNGVLWYSNTANTDGAGNITVTNEYTGHPAFVDPGAGDYHIGLTSEAIDKGISTTVDSDIDGDPRPQGSGYDLGADEICTIYLPVVMRNY